MEKSLTISQLAKTCHIGIETIRFYHRKKILDLPPKRLGSIRLYSADHVDKINFIKKSQSVGFTLQEIKSLLQLRLDPKSDCSPIKEKTRIKIKEVEEKIENLNRIRKALIEFETKCDGKETTGKCSILDGLKELPNG